MTSSLLRDSLPAAASNRGTSMLTGGEVVDGRVFAAAHVDRPCSDAGHFPRGLEDLGTERFGGTIWALPGLGARTRRVLGSTPLDIGGVHVAPARGLACSAAERPPRSTEIAA